MKYRQKHVQLAYVCLYRFIFLWMELNRWNLNKDFFYPKNLSHLRHLLEEKRLKSVNQPLDCSYSSNVYSNVRNTRNTLFTPVPGQCTGKFRSITTMLKSLSPGSSVSPLGFKSTLCFASNDNLEIVWPRAWEAKDEKGGSRGGDGGGR